MANLQSTASVPQGFSVYQPMLGAPLQFFPALGTKHLDDLMDAYFPGPASIKEKRATISLDFLDHIQRTGETFKFYAVLGSAASPESPASVSTSSINVSPVTSNWDWSSVSGPSAESSRASRQASTSFSRPQQTTGDFSHMPGMKIMTKDGLDVTNSASRGSKTKEQRDHAHLMRIIKACDSCRRKKIRCDPSHKKRGAASPVSASSTAKVVKKTAKSKEPAVAKALPMAIESAPPPAPSIDFDFSLTSDLDAFMPLDFAQPQPWEDLIQYPVEDIGDDYDFFFDPEGYISSESAAFSTPESQSLSKSISPSSVHEHVVSGLQDPLRGTDYFNVGQLAVNATPAPDFNIPVDTDYTDFNLFSPQSTFSEDDRMLSVASSTPSSASGEPLDGDLGRYRGASPSPLIHGSDRNLRAHGTSRIPGEVEQLGVADGRDGQNHNRLLSYSIADGTTDYVASDRLNASDLHSAAIEFSDRNRHNVSSIQSERDVYATSLPIVSFTNSNDSDILGSDILATPELSDSVSSLSSRGGSQSLSVAGIDAYALTGVVSRAESSEITNLEAASMHRNIQQEAAYAGEEQIVGDEQHATMLAAFAAIHNWSCSSAHHNSVALVERLPEQQLQGRPGSAPNANSLLSHATAAADADRDNQSTGQSPVDQPRVLLSTNHGSKGSKLVTSTNAPLSSDSVFEKIGFYGLAVLAAQATAAWNFFVTLAAVSVISASYLGQWLTTKSVKHEFGHETPEESRSLLSGASRLGHVSALTNKYMHRHTRLLGRQLLQAL